MYIILSLKIPVDRLIADYESGIESTSRKSEGRPGDHPTSLIT
jgi:hypothetical protein